MNLVPSITIQSQGRASAKGKKGPVHGGFALRAIVYAAAFLLAAKTAGLSGVGAGIGFFLPHVAMYYTLGLRPVIRRKLGREPRASYITDTGSRVFYKDPWMVIENYKDKDRSYVTFRHFRRIRVEEPVSTLKRVKVNKNKLSQA